MQFYHTQNKNKQKELEVMWVVTIFNNPNDIRMFEYTTKSEASAILEQYKNAVLSFTN